MKARISLLRKRNTVFEGTYSYMHQVTLINFKTELNYPKYNQFVLKHWLPRKLLRVWQVTAKEASKR